MARAAWRRALAAAATAWLLGAAAEAGQASTASSTVQRLTVVFELLVEDARHRPLTDIRLDEVVVVQDATRQRIDTFRAGSRPGLYEIAYAPLSGKPGGVTVRVTRPGTVVRGADGGSLKPRLVSPLSPLETELTGYLAAKAGASELACDVAVYRFEAVPQGVRHTVAVELPLSELRLERGADVSRVRLQVLARFAPAGRPDAVLHVTGDQVVELDGSAGTQRLVWTGTAVIAAGQYTTDVLVRDAATGRATTRTLSVDVPPAAEGIGLSSLVLLRPRSFFFLRDTAEGDDPLVYQGMPLMPTLRPTVWAATNAWLRFFVALYPVAGGRDPVTLTAELLRDGAKVGEAPIELPRPEPSGEIRYVGQLAAASLRPGSYVLRLRARQGLTTAAQEAAFVLAEPAPGVRLQP